MLCLRQASANIRRFGNAQMHSCCHYGNIMSMPIYFSTYIPITTVSENGTKMQVGLNLSLSILYFPPSSPFFSSLPFHWLTITLFASLTKNQIIVVHMTRRPAVNSRSSTRVQVFAIRTAKMRVYALLFMYYII